MPMMCKIGKAADDVQHELVADDKLVFVERLTSKLDLHSHKTDAEGRVLQLMKSRGMMVDKLKMSG